MIQQYTLAELYRNYFTLIKGRDFTVICNFFNIIQLDIRNRHRVSRKLMILCIRGNIVNKSTKLVFLFSALIRFSEAVFSLFQPPRIAPYVLQSN